jgi:mannose-6-phosphate isomerase-like protein (cupin superfamily)
MHPEAEVKELSTSELAAVVERVAADPAAWQHHVEHHADRRHYVQLHRDDIVDVWLICWNDEQETGFHDHDVSSGAFHVVDGAIAEDLLALDGARSRRFGRGDTASFGASHVHRLQHVGEQPTVTIHAYSPPLVRMGAYVVREDGVLERRTIPASEELKPLAGQV